MEKNSSCIIKNSELNVPKEKRAFLTYQSHGLCPCSLEEREDGVALNFDTVGLKSAQAILKYPVSDKLRFLTNAATLEKLSKDYDFSLALDNILFDLNLCCHILKRDLNCGGISFLRKYMALIGQVLASRYSYDDYLNGGDDLFKKHRLLSELSTFESIIEIRARLELEYNNTVRETDKKKILVSKNSVVLSRMLIPILTVLLIAATFFAALAHFIEIPHQEQIITASQAHIAGDYIAAQLALRETEPHDMTHETKHFLARSYVTTEAMTDEQKEHVLAGLTRMANTYLFDFWIHLGRLNFDEAIDIAQRFGDLELLLFAYLKQQVVVETDMTIPGDERVALLSYLGTQIARFQDERGTVNEE